jgi:murein DD-endopeptidase MepM/ murein hydrolase activator NlpD
MRRRYIITFARESSETPIRLAVDLRVLVAVAVLVIGSPILFTAGASWGTRALVADLLRQNAALELENANYRDATTELVTQVSALQTAAESLGGRAALDPDVARAIDRLPSSITRRAMGGGGTTAGDLAGPLTTVLSSADPAFGLLRDVLHIIERKLDHARSGVERREALAAATPSIWPVAGWLSSSFGSRPDPFTGEGDFHTGIDISADYGQPVLATADGTVVTARMMGNYGKLVVLDHGFGIGTRYGHLSRFAVKEGDRVKKGTIVGYVGSTGRSTSPHLHYELLLNGRASNPLRLLGRQGSPR